MKNALALLFILGITVMVTFALPNRRTRDVGLRNHIRRTKEFSCHTPQLRSINVEDLLTEASPDEQFVPAVTVLARCDEHTGCCEKNEICTPAEKTEVELVFMVNHLIDKERVRHHEIIRVDNHTRCHCVTEST